MYDVLLYRKLFNKYSIIIKVFKQVLADENAKYSARTNYYCEFIEKRFFDVREKEYE